MLYLSDHINSRNSFDFWSTPDIKDPKEYIREIWPSSNKNTLLVLLVSLSMIYFCNNHIRFWNLNFISVRVQLRLEIGFVVHCAWTCGQDAKFPYWHLWGFSLQILHHHIYRLKCKVPTLKSRINLDPPLKNFTSLIFIRFLDASQSPDHLGKIDFQKIPGIN